MTDHIVGTLNNKSSKAEYQHPFEIALSVSSAEIEIELRGQLAIPWADFILNPRRLRGSDFLMRWSQGVWSEEQLIQAVNQTDKYFALPYGPSGVAPRDDVREYELYFERLDKAGIGDIKRPDLLIFRKPDESLVMKAVSKIGGTSELPFIPEQDKVIAELLSRAIIAVECENSLWKATKMPQYGSPLKPMRRLGGKLGLAKSAVLPTVILKEEDRVPLIKWQNQTNINIHIWHVFFDLAFGLSLNTAQDLINNGRIEGTDQVFQAPGGATTTKRIYKIYYHYAYPLCKAQTDPTLLSDYIIDNNGHILPYVRFSGGAFKINLEALQVLSQASTIA